MTTHSQDDYCFWLACWLLAPMWPRSLRCVCFLSPWMENGPQSNKHAINYNRVWEELRLMTVLDPWNPSLVLGSHISKGREPKSRWRVLNTWTKTVMSWEVSVVMSGSGNMGKVHGERVPSQDAKLCVWLWLEGTQWDPEGSWGASLTSHVKAFKFQSMKDMESVNNLSRWNMIGF